MFSLRDAAFRADVGTEFGALASGSAPERLRAGRAGASAPAAPNVKIVMRLREDYLAELQEFAPTIPTLFDERLRLGPLSEEGVREAITGPARLTVGVDEEPFWAPPFELEPAALDGMIEFLKGKSGIVEPLFLQVLCGHAEAIAHGKARRRDGSVMLTREDFRGVRGFDAVLENLYRDILLKLPRPQRKGAHALCEEGLLNATGHRLSLEGERN